MMPIHQSLNFLGPPKPTLESSEAREIRRCGCDGGSKQLKKGLGFWDFGVWDLGFGVSGVLDLGSWDLAAVYNWGL